jgi:hypothetical protein
MAFVITEKTVSYEDKLLSDEWKARVTWLLKNYGPIGERWDYDCGKFFFKNEKDKLLFLLANS